MIKLLDILKEIKVNNPNLNYLDVWDFSNNLFNKLTNTDGGLGEYLKIRHDFGFRGGDLAIFLGNLPQNKLIEFYKKIQELDKKWNIQEIKINNPSHRTWDLTKHNPQSFWYNKIKIGDFIKVNNKDQNRIEKLEVIDIYSDGDKFKLKITDGPDEGVELAFSKYDIYNLNRNLKEIKINQPVPFIYTPNNDGSDWGILETPFGKVDAEIGDKGNFIVVIDQEVANNKKLVELLQKYDIVKKPGSYIIVIPKHYVSIKK